jgi:hypothetical protein
MGSLRLTALGRVGVTSLQEIRPWCRVMLKPRISSNTCKVREDPSTAIGAVTHDGVFSLIAACKEFSVTIAYASGTF